MCFSMYFEQSLIVPAISWNVFFNECAVFYQSLCAVKWNSCSRDAIVPSVFRVCFALFFTSFLLNPSCLNLLFYTTPFMFYSAYECGKKCGVQLLQ